MACCVQWTHATCAKCQCLTYLPGFRVEAKLEICTGKVMLILFAKEKPATCD